MRAGFACVHCGNHLFVLTESASMELDFFKLDPVAINFHLVVYPPQIQKVSSLIDFTYVAGPVEFLTIFRGAKCFSGFCWVVPIAEGNLFATEAELSFFIHAVSV